MTALVVAGSRDMTNEYYPVVTDAIDRWRMENGSVSGIQIIEGGCRGVDDLAGFYRRASHLPGRTMRADWRAHGHAAGPFRNQAMIELADGLVVVRFPDSRGSADILRRAKVKGIPIVDVVLERRVPT